MVDWTPLVTYDKALNIIARLSSRVIGGVELCILSQISLTEGRNPQYIRFAIRHATMVPPTAQILALIPSFLKTYDHLEFCDIQDCGENDYASTDRIQIYCAYHR